MKKLMYWSILLKSHAAMFLTGLIVLYMVVSTAQAFITGETLDLAIPFTYVIQSMVLAVVISVMWVVFFDDNLIKKTRYFKRLIMFSLALIPVFALCLWLFYVVSSEWTFMWVVIAGLLVIGLIIISLLFELYFKLEGKRYTNVLMSYNSRVE